MKAPRFVIAIAVILSLTGCNQTKEDTRSNMTTNHQAAYYTTSTSKEIVEYDYTDEELYEIADCLGKKEDILLHYYTDKVKTIMLLQNPNDETGTEEGSLVVYRGKTKILMLTFDSCGNKLSSEFHEMNVKKDAFDTIRVGSMLSEVQTVDPTGGYFFLYTGRNDPRVSAHYTTDGFLINITYDNHNVVENIEIIPL